ncbi:MAG: segregation/condensation protein A, partial [Actinomycetota bacterium]|nr:segregation/condensation protein A [Actinomycetota bacterium]
MTGERATTRVGEFAVEVPVFSGPFRVLADLLLERKVDVCDVPVAVVTSSFLATAEQAEGWTLEEATWFLAVCAALLEIKVGRLFPRSEPVDEEDLVGASPDLAYARGLELAAFRKAAALLGASLVEGSRYHPREAGPPEELAHLYPDVLERVTPRDVAEVAAAALRPQPAIYLSHVAPIRATVSDALAALTARLTEGGRARFRDLVADCRDRIQVVVRFLALLELY